MRKVRVHFLGMVGYEDFFQAFKALERLGVTSGHQFGDSGSGWFVLETKHPLKVVDKTLHVEMPEVYVAIDENITGEDNANCAIN